MKVFALLALALAPAVDRFRCDDAAGCEAMLVAFGSPTLFMFPQGCVLDTEHGWLLSLVDGWGMGPWAVPPTVCMVGMPGVPSPQTFFCPNPSGCVFVAGLGAGPGPPNPMTSKFLTFMDFPFWVPTDHTWEQH